MTSGARTGTAAPSGTQWQLAAGRWRGTVQVGGGIRELSAEGRDVLEPYPLEAMCDGMHDTPLVPWPNRLGDGAYDFGGAHRQPPLSEPDRRNAIHGLACWVPWRLVEQQEGRVVVAAGVHPQPGYPFHLAVQVAYELDADGLTVRTTATNVGGGPLPYAAGQHPYLSPGEGTIDDCVVRVPARLVLRTDSRALPLRGAAERTDVELRCGRPGRQVVLDDTFTDLVRHHDGRAWTRLFGRDGREVALRQDRTYAFLEITGDTLGPGRRRTGLGVEPMTAAPDAFRTGNGLTVLGPGDTTSSAWGVQLR